MDDEEIRQARFARVKAAHGAGAPASTILRARQYLDAYPGGDPLDSFEEAAECFREAIRRDPDDRDVHRALRDVERCLRISGRRR